MIRARSSPGEVRIAVVRDGTLHDYAIWRPGRPDGLGDIHLGRIAARVPAMAGAFVDIGEATGFLPDSDGAAGQPEGTLVTVRIARTAQGGKGPRLAAAPAGAAGRQPGLLARGATPLARLAAAHPDDAVVVDDAALFASLRRELGDRVQRVDLAWDDALEAEIDLLGAPLVELPGGMRATIVPTPALVAIDVDGGSATAARAPKSNAQMQANRAALPALVRQLALRNLSGAILVDFAGIAVRHRPSLAPELEAALACDPARPRLLGFTRLGLAEILRPRLAAPLHELLAGPHAAGLAALRRLAADPYRPRPVLRAHPAVMAALQADPLALADLARRLTHPLILRSDPGLPAACWTIEEVA